MNWERCGNTSFYRKTEGRETLYANPLNWSQVSVGRENVGEWQGIALVRYKKAEFDWEIFKKSVEKSVPLEDRSSVLVATMEWFHAMTKPPPKSKLDLLRLFKELLEEDRNSVLDGIESLMRVTAEMASVVAIEKDSSAYRDISDLRETFDYAQRFYIESTLQEAVDKALGHFGIYEC